jgi:EmrB/QacA subfamily drug resistance transporter
MSGTTAESPAGAASTAPAAQAGHAPSTGGFTHRQILTILAGLMMGMFLAALDQTIVASAIRTIGDDLHGLSIQAWVTTAYLITATISTPLYGKLSDIYGRKPLFLIAITLFLIGSAASAFSTSMYMLAAFRAFQGLGAGGLFSMALAILGDIVAPRERARYQGYFLAVFGTSSVIGPVIGGFFAGTSSILTISGWRWVFLVNVPIGLVALFVVWHTLNIPHVRREHRIDWRGSVAIAIALVPILIIAEQGRTWGWSSTAAFICYAIGAIGLGLFVLAESRIGDDALIPLRFFRNGVFSLTSGAGLLVGMGMFGGISLLPLYFQIVKGMSPTQSGLLLLPLTAGIMSSSIFSGQLISRTGRYKIYPVVGSALMVVGMGLMHFIGADTPIWQTGVYTAIFGLGLGGVMQPITLAVQNAMPPQDIGVATSSATFFRQMGGALGTAVFLSVLFSTVGDKIKSAYVSAAHTAPFQQAVHDHGVLANPGNQPILGIVKHGGGVGSSALNDTAFLNHADHRLAEPFFVGFSQSMDLVFIIGAAVLFGAFLLLLKMKEVPLRTQSAIQARAAQDAESAGRTEPTEPTATTESRLDIEPDDDPHPVGGHPAHAGDGVPPGPSQNGDRPVPVGSNGARSAQRTALATPVATGPIEEEALERLTAVLMPDPAEAVTAVMTADRARAEMQLLQSQLDGRRREYDGALRRLHELGLSDQQISRILGEPMPHAGRHHQGGDGPS